jgi:aspartate kinase
VPGGRPGPVPGWRCATLRRPCVARLAGSAAPPLAGAVRFAAGPRAGAGRRPGVGRKRAGSGFRASWGARAVRMIVQKFGGTSLADDARREAVADRVVAARRGGLTPVVVVSAMGRDGDPYATDTLLGMARSVYPNLPPREIDLLISVGEVISAVLVSAHLRRRGEPAVVLTGAQAGVITDRNFGNARILRVEPDHLRRHVERGDLCVVAGFQGMSESGDITTLGRGGSDTTAAALGVALRAELVEIYTDVEGVKTADPRIVPEARTLRVVSYEEIFQMAHQGAKVVHPRAVELAMRANVPLRVRSAFADDDGTLITHNFETSDGWAAFAAGRVVTGVTHVPDVALVAVTDGGREPPVRVFRPLADAGISVDLINVSAERQSFIVLLEEAEKTRRILEAEGFHVQVRRDCAKVSIVGAGMRGLPGVMAAVSEALAQAGVEILQTADSHVTISCLVDRADMERAVQALHRKFGLERS